MLHEELVARLVSLTFEMEDTRGKLCELLAKIPVGMRVGRTRVEMKTGIELSRMAVSAFHAAAKAADELVGAPEVKSPAKKWVVD